MSAGRAGSALVLRPGMLSSIQDLGRPGLQHLGIVPGGVMDAPAHQLANVLVGNSRNEATLEVTMIGPELKFTEPVLIALTGAQFDVTVNGEKCPQDRPVLLSAGARLHISHAFLGGRACLAIAGGIQVDTVLGSRSTYLPAGFGGLHGRALRSEDHLPLVADVAEVSASRFARLTGASRAIMGSERHNFVSVPWLVPPMTLPDRDPILVRAMPGMHFEWFSPEARQQIFQASWKVSPQSNRIGFRLLGPELQRHKSADILSGPTCLGTVQVPASGLPIALMADHQTTGGYAKIVEVAGADIARLAQLRPGERLRFVRCTLDEALAFRNRARKNLEAKIRSIQSEYKP